MAEQEQVAAEGKVYDIRDINAISKEFRFGFLCHIIGFGLLTLILSLSTITCGFVLKVSIAKNWITILNVLSGVFFLPTITFFLLVFFMFHNERAEPQCRCKCLEIFFRFIPSRYTSIMDMLLEQRPGEIPTPIVHDIEQEGIPIPENRVPDEDTDQGAVPVKPDVPELPEKPDEKARVPPIELNYNYVQLLFDDSKSHKAGPSNLPEESSFSSLNETPKKGLDSRPTDSVPIISTKPFPDSEGSGLATGSLSDVHSFSEHLERDISDRQSLRGRAIGEQVVSAGPTSEEISQLGQDAVGIENFAYASQSSEEISLPMQVVKDEIVDSFDEELRRSPEGAESEP